MLTQMVLLGYFARTLYKRKLPAINTTSNNIQNRICVIGDLSKINSSSCDQKDGGVVSGGVVNASFVH